MELIDTEMLIHRRLQEQVNVTLEKGSLIAAILGLVSAEVAEHLPQQKELGAVEVGDVRIRGNQRSCVFMGFCL
jgi:Zn-dependent membrane protease YugP